MYRFCMLDVILLGGLVMDEAVGAWIDEVEDAEAEGRRPVGAWVMGLCVMGLFEWVYGLAWFEWEEW